MKNIFSVSRVTEKLLFSVKRFPVTVLLTVGWAALLFIRKGTFFGIVHSRVDICLAIGIFISLAAVLWLEDVVDYLRQQVITVAVTLFWGVYCLYLPEAFEFSVAKMIELAVIGIVAFLSIFFVSFLARGKDRAFWNFSVQMVLQLALAQFFGMVIYGGLCLAMFAIESLLGVSDFLENSYRYLSTLCFNLFVTIYFLASIPDKTSKCSEEISLNRYLKIFALYILTPIAAIYALILYVYLFKIVFEWELPKGMVSYMVSTLAVSGLLIIALLYPARLEGRNRFIVFLTRYFGLMILPLLALMTVGIFRRMGDYGITIHRGYLLLVNLWFYGIYIYLVLTKAERIKWIPISFAAIALFVSFGYWSVPNVTKHILVSELNGYLGGQKIPLFSEAVFEEFSKNIGKEEWEKISSKIEYLNDRYGKESVQPFFSDSLALLNVSVSSRFYRLRSRTERAEEKKNFYYNAYETNEIHNLNSFNTFAVIDCDTDSLERDKKKISCDLEDWRLTINVHKDGRKFGLPLQGSVIGCDDENIDRPKKRMFQYDDYAVIIRYSRGYCNSAADSISLANFQGYLFYNK
ncbi:MAG: DUF4153 domain-containing protein [Chitinispirillales bacterium]|nr:DUF4153 domain-containing protein [Chitinispirillales bacterium]